MSAANYYSKAYIGAKTLPLTQDANNQGIGTDQTENQTEQELRSSLAGNLRPHCPNGALAPSLNGAQVEFATVSGAAGISGGGKRVASLDPVAFTGGDAADTYYLYYDQSADAGAKQIDGSGYPVAPDILIAQVDWDGAATLSNLVDLRRTVPYDQTSVISARGAHDGGASQTIGVIPARSLLEGAVALCDETETGGSGFSIDVGDAADPDGILEYADLGTTAGDCTGNRPAELGIYLSDGAHPRQHYYATPTAITAAVAGTATTGEWTIILIVRELPFL